MPATVIAEKVRLAEDARRLKNWKRWGPYLAERQWGTVREDYSDSGNCWDYFPHDHARSRTYRWGEDGLLGFTDRECRLCFAVALWNEQDPFLKERLFGLSGTEGNHGEDCKELYYYLDATPTFSYARALYKYPQQAFPYERLRKGNAARGPGDPELEVLDTGVFDDDRYFDISIEYAKAGPNDLLIQITAANRGPASAPLHLIPSLWFRNTWTWGCEHEGCTLRPTIRREDETRIITDHESLGRFHLAVGSGPQGATPEFLFTDNESNAERLWGTPSRSPFQKDAFHRYIVQGEKDAVNPRGRGTKAAAHHVLTIPPDQSAQIRLRLYSEDEVPRDPLQADAFRELIEVRRKECNEFHETLTPPSLTREEQVVQRQAYAGLLWSRQFYHYSVRDWLRGDPQIMTPPESRHGGRNSDWRHLFNRDIVSMPDKWEYPWYAAWDLAFHMIPMAHIDPDFAKKQLILFLREWYMHPSGQIPAYEFAFGDVNPPVHAWACWRVYKMTAPAGARDTRFLERAFHKLLINFTWWVNRKDPEGRNVFTGGFLGLDNIGVFDRSRPLPTGGRLLQADATAWMAFYCTTMLAIALELAEHNPAYQDIASKFFEHFVAIADAMNHMGGTGLWDDEDGFYYDLLQVDNRIVPLRVRSLVGLIPLCAVDVLHESVVNRLPGFRKRMNWFLAHRKDLGADVSWMLSGADDADHRLLAIPSAARLRRLLTRLFDENEFLSPFGIRSLSKAHEAAPYRLEAAGREWEVRYQPGESEDRMFGGNSNWRGPVWFPVNFLIIEALERYYHFFGNEFQIEYPTGSGRKIDLKTIADDLASRLVRVFLPDADGARPCHGTAPWYARNPRNRDLVLFYEYFHAESGRGLGASHQTGWTALVAKLVRDRGEQRSGSLQAQPSA